MIPCYNLKGQGTPAICERCHEDLSGKRVRTCLCGYTRISKYGISVLARWNIEKRRFYNFPAIWLNEMKEGHDKPFLTARKNPEIGES